MKIFLTDSSENLIGRGSGSSSGETWIINEEPSFTPFDVTINFVSWGISFSEIKMEEGPDCYELIYSPTSGSSYYVYASDPSVEGRADPWLASEFRTVIFETAPTGTLLTWLQANAVKQESGETSCLFRYTLPGAYQKVEYLMSPSTGNAYINTGINLSGDGYSYETKVDISSISSVSLFGAQNNQELMVFYSGSSYCYGGSGTATNRIVNNIYTAGTSVISSKYNSGTVSINVNGTSRSYSAVTNFTTMNYPFYLFTNNNAGNLTSQMTKDCKMYYFKLSQSDKVLRYFWPVKRISDNEAGMYDVENDIFYTNAGSGTFTAGPDI